MADAGGAELNEDESLCCSICFQKYYLHPMRPKVLPCSRTFCFTCVKALHSGNTLKCPVCQREAVKIADVSTLPTNNYYVQDSVHLSEKLRDAQDQIKRNNIPVLNTDSMGGNIIEVLSNPAPKYLRVLDWGRLVSGCACFSRMMLLQNPDIVFVKDIDEDLLRLLKKVFPKFKFIAHEKLRVVVILNETVSYDSHFIFPEDEGYRNDLLILEVNAHCGPMKLKLLQTELSDYAGRERHVNHLKAIFREVRHTDNNVNVILGVGGYVSNKKVMDAGGLPTCLQCMWEACGKPKKCKLKFTSNVARLTIESLNEENFTANSTPSDYVNGSDRFFLSRSPSACFVEPKSFRHLYLHNHSVFIVDLIIKLQTPSN